MRWIEDLFASIDEMDAEKFVSFMTDDARLRYGSNKPTVGKSAIGEYVGQFFGMFKRLRHQLIGSRRYCQVELVLARLDVSPRQQTHEYRGFPVIQITRFALESA
jgi:hypothetical protein